MGAGGAEARCAEARRKGLSRTLRRRVWGAASRRARTPSRLHCFHSHWMGTVQEKVAPGVRCEKECQPRRRRPFLEHAHASLNLPTKTLRLSPHTSRSGPARKGSVGVRTEPGVRVSGGEVGGGACWRPQYSRAWASSAQRRRPLPWARGPPGSAGQCQSCPQREREAAWPLPVTPREPSRWQRANGKQEGEVRAPLGSPRRGSPEEVREESCEARERAGQEAERLRGSARVWELCRVGSRQGRR